MTVTTETATVYRGGRRRWFSLDAAIKAEAQMLHRQRFKPRCECEDGDEHMLGETCQYHEYEFYRKFVRRVTRLIKTRIGEQHEPNA